MATTYTTYTGNGQISTSDYKDAKWVGKTKDGKAVTIILKDAVNLGNIDWTLAEKDEVVPEIVMTATYDNTDNASSSDAEPWRIVMDSSVSAGAGEILLGVGVFYLGNTAIGLTRGGGKFTVERTTREIRADGDRGPVKDRIVIDESRATLTMNVLTVLTNLASLYPGVVTTTATN